MKTSHRFLSSALCLLALFVLHAPFFTARAAAQAAPGATAQRAVITGRVSDAVANTYLNNAEVRVVGTNILVYTEADGTFRLEAPAGTVSITVSYTSNRPETRTIEARPGANNVLDFVLQPVRIAPVVTRPGAVAKPDDDIVVLETYVVTDERIGQAKMIMEQRAADNVKTIISADQFGDLTQGSVGEFMKYMPGITLDLDDEGELAYARVGGLDPKYAGFSIDGVGLASATEGQSRANHFQQMSMAAIESIEFNQTLLARMPANTPAGQFELKTRYSFNRKKPELGFDIGFDGTADTIELGSAYMPDNKKRMRTNVGGRLSYGGVFLNKTLGIEASVSHYRQSRVDQRHTVTYVYPVDGVYETGELKGTPLNPGTVFVERNGRKEALQGPTIRQLEWLNGPRIRTTQSANLSIDYKLSPYAILGLRSNYVLSENEYWNVYYQLLAENRDDSVVHNQYAPSPGVDAGSTLTRWVVKPTGPGGTQALESVLLESPSFRVARKTNYLLSPRFNYKKDSLEVAITTAYSYSREVLGDGEEGRFRAIRNRLGGIGWTATRESTSSPTWYLTQDAGSLWTEPQNLSRAATYAMGTWTDFPHVIRNIQASAKLDLTYAMRVFDHPVTLRAGGSVLESKYKRRYNRQRYNYIGPEGTQLASLFPMADKYLFNIDLNGKSGNINDQGWPVVDQAKLYSLLRQNPEWFVPYAVDNLQQSLTGRNDLTERISALYAEFTTRLGSRASLNLGVRGERTESDILFARLLTNEELEIAKALGTPEEHASGKFDPGCINGKLFQYNYGGRGTRSKDYDNLFLSGGIKYDFTKNLRFQLSFSQAILRPDYTQTSGVLNYPEYYIVSLWVPNPKLKPERTTKYYAGIQYYFKHAGILELSAFRLDIKDMQSPEVEITRGEAEEQLGYSFGDIVREIELEDGAELLMPPSEREAKLDRIVFRSTINARGGARNVYGVTLRYDQNLTFLPGALKGLAIFSQFTTSTLKNGQRDEEKIGRAGKSASGGIKYRYGRLSVRLSGTWTDDALKYITRPYADRKWVVNDYRYQKARFVMDFSGDFRLTNNLSIVFSVRNLTRSPYIYYSNVPDRLAWYSVPDTIWNISLRGKY